MTKELLEYFKNDELAANVWQSKYQVKNDKGEVLEQTPLDMHRRLAREFARIEDYYFKEEKSHDSLSMMGKLLHNKYNESPTGIYDIILLYFKDFEWIVPQGSIMALLGHPYKKGSLSNCFIIPSPEDSYGGILKTDEQLVQLMKRRGGVGTSVDTLRPSGAQVSNAAQSSTGAVSFMHRYSNSTREVAQGGRRGALMILLSCEHPDIFQFVTSKVDRTKVTGANISVLLTDKFMKAAKENKDFICRFPLDLDISDKEKIPDNLPYNKVIHINDKLKGWIMRIHAKELFDLIIEMAWENAEPGIAFIDRVQGYSPDGVYERYRPKKCNPCAEIFTQDYDSCRLMAMNLYSFVRDPFTTKAKVDYEKLYEVAYMQQRLADTLVDLEIESIESILNKINLDPESDDVKRVERELWHNILREAKAGRRTGCGFTALGDLLAALNLKYDSEESLKVVDQIMRIKMRAELDCTIDLAILRGPFEGWDRNVEYTIIDQEIIGNNEWYIMLKKEFPEQFERMLQFGRRQISMSTVAPTGSVSILTKSSSGLEPLFLPYYMRRKKINSSDKDAKCDFIDNNGDKWQQFPIIHPKFELWIKNFVKEGIIIDNTGEYEIKHSEILSCEKALDYWFHLSPWYKSCANDISWENRVKIQSIIQKYTTHSVSSTINLPKDVTKEEVAKIYWAAWHMGLKGITV